MDAGERPAKMRKIDHAADDGDVQIADAAPANGEETAVAPTTTSTSSEVTGKAPTGNADSGEEIILTGIPVSNNDTASAAGTEGPKLSKSAMKKQRRLQEWEAGREDRKVKRREKIKEKKERRRQEYQESLAAGVTPPPDLSRSAKKGAAGKGTQLPITVVFDCDFEDYMFDNELKSLGLQITRCYSDNRKAPFRFHLAVSSFGGKMRERFDGILDKQYVHWKGTRFCEEDFVQVSGMAKEWMKGPKGGKLAGALKQDAKAAANPSAADEKKEGDVKEEEEEGEVVYLSSESDVTLERLKPNSTYIIGGLVDKNRHKGLCYKRAVARGIKTAKLPISEFLQMNSRQVLVTNHVLDIMLKWAESGDWGKAFMEVMPKRKGGVLKSAVDGEGEVDGEGDGDENGEEDGGVPVTATAPTEATEA